jgi:hypothetical protein
MKRKLWRKFGGKNYQIWYNTKNKKARDLYVESLRLNGYAARVVNYKDGYQIYRRKRR